MERFAKESKRAGGVLLTLDPSNDVKPYAKIHGLTEVELLGSNDFHPDHAVNIRLPLEDAQTIIEMICIHTKHIRCKETAAKFKRVRKEFVHQVLLNTPNTKEIVIPSSV